MITAIKKGNVLDFTEDLLAHGCNCQGVMGAGVAKAIAQKWPHVFELYHHQFRTFGLELGTVHTVALEDLRVVLNCMTQELTGPSVRQLNYEALVQCFEFINRRFPNQTLAIPQIGAGLAGGNWNIIKAIINETTPDVDVTVYEL